MDTSYLYGLDDELFDFGPGDYTGDAGDYVGDSSDYVGDSNDYIGDSNDYAGEGDYDDSYDSPSSNSSDIENQIVYDPHPNTISDLVREYNNNVDRIPTGTLHHHGHGKQPGKKVMQRKAANMRERRRMKSINDAFETLRTCIPANVQAERRLSKVDTLRLAMRYISYLSDLVQSCSEYSRDVGSQRGHRVQEKVIVRCHLTELDGDVGDGQMLLGHSLSWHDPKGRRPTPDTKLVAKIWVPENPTESDLINLATYTSDY